MSRQPNQPCLPFHDADRAHLVAVKMSPNRWSIQTARDLLGVVAHGHRDWLQWSQPEDAQGGWTAGRVDAGPPSADPARRTLDMRNAAALELARACGITDALPPEVWP